jgi:Arc/MetJ-type ribon-helix-helix transcriptional regulator
VTTIAVSVTDEIAEAAKAFIKAGYFRTESDVVIAAMVDFLRRNRVELLERFAEEDIAWAKAEARKAR